MNYTTNHFSLAMPAGDTQNDIPALMRRLASEIEKAGEIEIMDIVFHDEMDIDGDPYPYFTVYYDKPSKSS